MYLTPAQILDSPLTEDAALIFKSGIVYVVDDWSPVYDHEGKALDFGDGNIRVSATTDEGFVIYFDSADLESFELGYKDSDNIAAGLEYDGPDQEPLEDYGDETEAEFLDFLDEMLGGNQEVDDVIGSEFPGIDGCFVAMDSLTGVPIELPAAIGEVLAAWGRGELQDKYDSIDEAINDLTPYNVLASSQNGLFGGDPILTGEKSFLDEGHEPHPLDKLAQSIVESVKAGEVWQDHRRI